MKFGKEFKKHMVPEWAKAYMDYNGLKRILREARRCKQSKHPATKNRALRQKQTWDRTFSGQSLQSSIVPSKGDIEDQVIDIDTLHRDGSRKVYKTKFLRQSEEGGEVEAVFFRKLDEELNKVNTFYKDKVEALLLEDTLLNKQMDALIALRIKVQNPHLKCSNLKRRNVSNVSLKLLPTRATCSGDRSPGKCRTKTIWYVLCIDMCRRKTCIQVDDYL